MLSNAISSAAGTPEQQARIAGISISAVIVNYCTKCLLQDCLISIGKSGVSDLEVIVVDNHSTDGSVSMVRREFPDVRVIENLENVGFSRANNQGIEVALGKYILLLNSDTVVRPGAVEAMAGFMDGHPQAGGVACRLLNADGSIQPSVGRRLGAGPGILRLIVRMSGLSGLVRGDRARRFLGRYLSFALGPALRSYLDPYVTGDFAMEVDSISGACLMLRREAVDQAGLLDENFFMYLEDLDYCIRLRMAGWKLYYVPTGEIVHLVGKSSGGRMRRFSVHAYESLFYFYSKHYSTWTLFLARLLVFSAMCSRWVWNFARGSLVHSAIHRQNHKDLEKVIRLCLQWRPPEARLRTTGRAVRPGQLKPKREEQAH
jgi:GT2 family glycosyltransferase